MYFFVGAAIHSLHHGNAKRRERQFATSRAFQVCAHVRVYLIQNNVFEVDSTKNHVFTSCNNNVKWTYNTCSVHTRVSVLDHLWFYLANLYPTAFITNHTTLYLAHPWHFPMST